MPKKKKTQSQVSGQSGVTANAARLARTPSNHQFPTDPLGKHIARLFKLHPNLQIQFRDFDLSTMGEDTKKSLLEDINDVLGIKPLKTSQS